MKKPEYSLVFCSYYSVTCLAYLQAVLISAKNFVKSQFKEGEVKIINFIKSINPLLPHTFFFKCYI